MSTESESRRDRLDRLRAGGHIITRGESVLVFVDGACPGNGRPDAVAGIGLYWGMGPAVDKLLNAEPMPPSTYTATNSRAELYVSPPLHR
jgi:hypothetical protein